MSEPKLYVLATPLGNRDDITLRAVEVLKTTRVIFCEDTRETRKLFEMLNIPATGKNFHSYASHNMKEATVSALSYLGEGLDVALVTDRGTPGLSDPGALLVAEAREQGFAVRPVPGPSALGAIWSVAGLKDRGFAFLGFFPETAKEQTALLETVAAFPFPVVFYESPRRVEKTVALLRDRFPQGRLFIGREMTKAFEEYRWIDLTESETWDSLETRGEYSLILVPGLGAIAEPVGTGEDWIKLRLCSDKEWSKAVAERTGQSAKELYNALQERKRQNQL